MAPTSSTWGKTVKSIVLNSATLVTEMRFETLIPPIRDLTTSQTLQVSEIRFRREKERMPILSEMQLFAISDIRLLDMCLLISDTSENRNLQEKRNCACA